MKRILIIIAFTALFSCANDTTPVDGEMVPELASSMKIEPYDDGSGLLRVTAYAADGKVSEQGYYLNGYREGVYSEFHRNGLIKSTVGYVQGKKEGYHLLIDVKGQVLERSTYHNDLLNGEHTKYNRTTVKERSHYSNGQLHGMAEKFYANGSIMERSNYNLGQYDGIARWYNQAGNNTIAYNYKMGELIGDAELEPPIVPTPAN
jgi:antitoxin component YwqK of YwqJK toxin-antitoxin module